MRKSRSAHDLAFSAILLLYKVVGFRKIASTSRYLQSAYPIRNTKL